MEKLTKRRVRKGLEQRSQNDFQNSNDFDKTTKDYIKTTIKKTSQQRDAMGMAEKKNPINMGMD